MSDDLRDLANKLNIDLETDEFENDVVVEEKKVEKPKRGRPRKKEVKEAVKEKVNVEVKKAKQDKKIANRKVPDGKLNKNIVFGEWMGFKVNYLGKPMLGDGEFITLSKRYNSKEQEKFRAINGRMVLVIEKNKSGDVEEVKVFAEDVKGKREQLLTAGKVTNKNRMENRCRVYAVLLELAYDRKKDIEEIVKE